MLTMDCIENRSQNKMGQSHTVDSFEARRVLIVDDDEADRTLCKYHLTADKNYAYRIDEAANGTFAAELISSNQYDCILLDYYLFDTNGLQLIDSFKALTQCKTPIVVLSGQGSETIAAQCMRIGAADYIPKRNISSESLTRTIINAVEKAKLRNEIDLQTQNLRQKNRELTSKHAEIQRFYQTVSHELKTPLTSMKEFVSIIMDEIAGPISEEQREYLELVNLSCVQMAHDINDLLDVTRIETGKYCINPTPTDLHSLLITCIEQMDVIAKEKSINLSLNASSDLPEMLIDPRRIEQVVNNLISNALRFTPANGSVHVHAALCDTIDNRIVISVQDSGRGIEEDKLEQIFDRLYQINPEQNAESLASSKAGLGLGLSIAREIVHLHHGELNVESKLGFGSKFSFMLPVQTATTITNNKDVLS